MSRLLRFIVAALILTSCGGQEKPSPVCIGVIEYTLRFDSRSGEPYYAPDPTSNWCDAHCADCDLVVVEWFK